MEVIQRSFRRLFETSPEIEARPLYQRPRFMAAAWGGLIVCKLGSAMLISVEAGLLLLAVTLAGGTLATVARFSYPSRTVYRTGGESRALEMRGAIAAQTRDSPL